MLFDLRGRRRRAVQATYLTLAVLMGGGLVLFGIGGNTSGGLFDAFKGGNSGGGNDALQKRIDREEKTLRRSPENVAVLKNLVRDEYQLATSKTAANAVSFPKDAQEAAAIIAERDNSSAGYIRLVQYAALAGDTRTANLAGQKAVDLAPKGAEKNVKAQVKQAKQVQAGAGSQGAAGSP